MLDTDSGRWRSLASLPESVFGVLETAGDANRIFGFSATDGETQRQIALEYDIGADRWAKLPEPE